MKIREKALILSAGLAFIVLTPVSAAVKKTYTSTQHLYSIDYPADWRVKEIGKVSMFLSPLESKEDVFAENVDVVVEDLSRAGDVTLIDYHRKSIGGAPKMLKDFKPLEEAVTEFAGHQAIAVLYTARVKDKIFRFKAYTLLVGQQAYVLTYKALNEDFEKYLPAAEKVMRSLQASP